MNLGSRVGATHRFVGSGRKVPVENRVVGWHPPYGSLREIEGGEVLGEEGIGLVVSGQEGDGFHGGLRVLCGRG